MERLAARHDPLAAKQRRAVELQERGGARIGMRLAGLSSEQIREARANPDLAEAERLFGEILDQAERLTLGQTAITRLQLGILLHRQARLDEACVSYESVVRACRLASEQTDSITWALTRALFGLALLVIDDDHERGRALLAEARELARRRRDRAALILCDRALRRFGTAHSDGP